MIFLAWFFLFLAGGGFGFALSSFLFGKKFRTLQKGFERLSHQSEEPTYEHHAAIQEIVRLLAVIQELKKNQPVLH